MKRLLGIIVFLFLASTAISQPYGNEWIDYSQQYFKFPIVQSGVYRITYADLQNSGVPFAGQDPRKFQIFGRGKQQYLYIAGESDGSFDQGDYIEFYAKANDGYLDSLVYPSPNEITNPFHSLFSDTAYYFFSIASGTNNNRFTVETDLNLNNFNSTSYVWSDVIQDYPTGYFLGPTNAYGVTDPEYVSGEGWIETTNQFGIGGSVTKAISTPNAVNGPNALFRAGVVGISKDGHSLRIALPNASQLDTAWNGSLAAKFSISIPSSSLGANSNFTFLGLSNASATSNNKKAISYVWVRYPKQPNGGGVGTFRFLVEDNPSQSKYRVDFTNVLGAQSSAYVYDLTNHRRLPVGGTGGTFSFLIPNGGLKECVFTGEGQALSVGSIRPCGLNGYFTNLTTLNNPKHLIVSHQSLMADANAYAAYRTSQGMPGFAIDVAEVYDQFAHGIKQNPLAIRRFSEYGLDVWNSTHIFIIGKSVMSDFQMKWRTDPNYAAQNLVPSWGFPSSDNLITAGLNGGLWQPTLYIGRLAAKVPEHVQLYLNKVIDYEAAALNPVPWMKRIAHFSGGSNTLEQATLLSYLNSYKNTLEDTLFGGTVSTFQSTTSAPINISLADSIRSLVNGGVSIMTFFGHAAGSGFDVSTDEPSTYSNAGKYPLIVANSCLAGDIHLPDNGQSQSEPWVLLQDKGAIGFLAQITKGLQQYLHIYSTSFFRNLGQNFYGKTLGEIISRTVSQIQNPNNTDTKDVCLEMTLHGDPALIINSPRKPDLMVSPNTVFTTPSDVTTTLDSFQLNVVITNQGRAFEDTFNIEVIRTRPDGVQDQPITYTWLGQFPNGSHFRDTLRIAIPINLTNAAGINRFSIHVDNIDQIDELTNLNNNIDNYEILIKSPDIFPVYPYKFAIVGNQGITLKASTGDPFAPLRTYRFQIDTTDLYNSPLLQTTMISSTGGVVSWTPSLLANMPDSTVYYWRCITDSLTTPGNYQWRESTFQYINGKRGMGQSHFFQFKENLYNLLKYNRPGRQWDFSTSGRQISCHNFSPSTSNFNEVEWRLDGELEEYGFGGMSGGCNPYTPSVCIAVIDNTTLQAWRTYFNGQNAEHRYGNCENPNRTMGWFMFQTSASTAQQDSMVSLLQNHIPDSFYILAYSWRYGEQEAWQPSARQAFSDLGFTQINTLSNGLPWIFFTQKGNPSSTQTVVAQDPADVIEFQRTLLGSYYLGEMTTPLLGPATQWRSLHIYSSPSETPDFDSTSVKVIGVTAGGLETELFHVNHDTDIVNLNTLVDAVQYPMIKLKGYYRDDTLRTPAQMDRWQLIFDGVPECALNPALSLTFKGDSLQQYDTLKLGVAITNIGEYDMDSLKVKYWIEDENHIVHPIAYPRQKPLLVNQSLIDTIAVPTALYSGNSKIWVEANPANDQPEQYHFNNIGYLNFYSQGDRINPLMDVTFDGVHIINRDIVSAKPNIVIELRDENQYLLMNDTLAGDGTSMFKVLIKEPNAAQYKQIYFKNYTQMQFEPAVPGKNKCKILYPAEFPVDGVYELIVQAKDKSNNSSGQIDYKIEFEVVNKSTITEVLNYPNPFTTSTRFVFVLTGSEVPDNFKIQILTVTGKVVKEIDNSELGSLHVGRNITNYAWDGTDEYGDRLANGVYLYRVVHKINGQDIEHRATAADEYFKKGWGKMYLMR